MDFGAGEFMDRPSASREIKRHAPLPRAGTVRARTRVDHDRHLRRRRAAVLPGNGRVSGDGFVDRSARRCTQAGGPQALARHATRSAGLVRGGGGTGTRSRPGAPFRISGRDARGAWRRRAQAATRAVALDLGEAGTGYVGGRGVYSPLRACSVYLASRFFESALRVEPAFTAGVADYFVVGRRALLPFVDRLDADRGGRRSAGRSRGAGAPVQRSSSSSPVVTERAVGPGRAGRA